jgi:hypothetical protein
LKKYLAAINFDQPSKGQVNSLTQPALTILNRGVGIRVTNDSRQSAMVVVANGDPVTTVGGTSPAIHGISNYGGDGVIGETSGTPAGPVPPGKPGAGVVGKCKNWVGVYGESETFQGVHGESKSNTGVGVAGFNNQGGMGVLGSALFPGTGGHFEGQVGVSARGTTAGRFEGNVEVTGDGRFEGNVEVTGDGRFEGNVEVTGDIRLLNADCAENFDISSTDDIQPGTVMVLNEDGGVESSQHAYDKKVAGIISGAGCYKPGIVLGGQESGSKRIPIALMGKVFCKVDANYSCIEVGDMLTTSATAGHAMKASDPSRAFGTVIGKALGSMKEGLGLIPVLVALQ